LIVEKNGRPSKCGDFEAEFIKRLVEIREERQDLLEAGFDVSEAYGGVRTSQV
jgi:hypothetical protein